MNKKKEFLNQLYATKSEQEWYAVCDKVKEYTKTLPEDQKDGLYPDWWFGDVVFAGVISHACKNWH